MTLASNFTLFLMAFMVDFLWATTVSPLASQSPLTKIHIIYIEDDYDYGEGTPQPKPNSSLPRLTTAQSTPQACDYDLCVVQDVPCFMLSTKTKCYCPGLTGPEQVPEPPQLRELKQRASGEVEVYWCAPLSTITHYKVVMDDEEGHGPVFSELSRNGTIQGLKVGSRVCVVAVNNAGFSVKNDRSCARFEPQQTSQAALMSGVIVGCIGFLVLLSLAALLLWRRKSCKKSGTLDGVGLRNPTYSANETI
ncbi:LRRN4 C-terminal-like protein [Colossoma macropomum]|uniref:LRRN4 C-terminal-like protein n=1 Tax=Colossoma macropomum TaxID=42526 RepID=UPI00186562A0|nr:LRRN4 C-terminal-like protein [Colossoma macropomum]